MTSLQTVIPTGAYGASAEYAERRNLYHIKANRNTMQKGGYVYIMTNKNRTTLYIGITNDLQRRVWEHRNYFHKNCFTAKYNLENCIYYEFFQNIEEAIRREKQLKKWNRAKKEMLINNMNPAWNDLWEEINI